MTPEERTKLRTLAQAATPGYHDDPHDLGIPTEDAAFIAAANPAAVLGLLGQVEYYRESNRERADQALVDEARIAELKAALKRIADFAEHLDARSKSIAKANPDHTVHVELCRQHAAIIRREIDLDAWEAVE